MHEPGRPPQPDVRALSRIVEVPDPVVMGVVNVTPDSFSDGGEWLDPRRGGGSRPRAGRRGRRDPGHRRRVDAPRGRAGRAEAEELRRVVGVLVGLADLAAAGPAPVDRHHQGGGRRGGAGRRRADRQRRHRAARRPGDGRARRRARLRLLPDAHARRAAHDAGATRATTTSSPRSRRSWRSAWPSRSRRASPRSASGSIRASASARRSTTTSSCCGACDELVALGRPVVDRHVAQVLPRHASPAASRASACPATIATNVLALARGAPRVPRPRRRRRARCARGGGCYVARAMAPGDDDVNDEEGEDDSFDDEEPASRPSSPSRSTGCRCTPTTA